MKHLTQKYVFAIPCLFLKNSINKWHSASICAKKFVLGSNVFDVQIHSADFGDEFFKSAKKSSMKFVPNEEKQSGIGKNIRENQKINSFFKENQLVLY